MKTGVCKAGMILVKEQTYKVSVHGEETTEA